MIVVGIDPGKDGFIAELGEGMCTTWPTPTVKIARKGTRREYDLAEMRRILAQASADLVVIEKQQSMPEQGVATTFQIGMGYGLWLGLVAGLGLPVQVVHPRTWQARMHRDVPGDDTKGRSIVAAGRLFPQVDLRATERCRVPHHGKADALLLAWYGLHVLAQQAADVDEGWMIPAAG